MGGLEIEPDPWGRGVAVTISHDLTYPFRFLNGWFARDLVGRDFVHAIAGRTLQTIKEMVETGSRHRDHSNNSRAAWS